MNLQTDFRNPAPPNRDFSTLEQRAAAMLDLPDLLRMIRVRLKIILGAAVFVVALTAIYVVQQTPIYTATSSVMLNDRQNTVMGGNSILSELTLNNTSVQNQIQIIRSRNLIGRVVDDLEQSGGYGDGAAAQDGFSITALVREFNPLRWLDPAPPDLTPEEAVVALRDRRIDGLLGNMTVESEGASTAMNITFRSANPARAARIANLIAEAYVEDQLNAKFEASQATNLWLDSRLEELAREVQVAESAVQEYRADNNLTNVGGEGSLADAQLPQINAELVVARSNLAQEEAKYAQIVALQQAGREMDTSQIVSSPMIMQLRTEQSALLREEAELATRYGERHPRMLDIASQLENIEDKIVIEVERVVATVANDVAVARARVRSLEQSISQLTTQTQGEGRSRIRLRELESEAASVRSLYEAFLTRFDEVQGQQDLQTPDARVISRADVPRAPSYPNKARTLTLSVPGGLLLGFLLAFLAERLDTGFRTATQLEQALGLPVLSTLPETQGRSKTSGAPADAIVEKPLSAFTEAIRGLQLGLDLSNIDQKPKVILVTSSVPEEGKTTVAVSLARLAARNGRKTVLIDADMRRPSVADTFGIQSAKAGLVEAITGEAPLNKCLVNDPRSSVVFLPTLKKAPNPPELLGSAAMERFITGLRNYYDLVIIDSAPLLPVNDTKIIAQFADAVVFVVRWEKTPREAVRNGLRGLTDVGAKVAGFALSRADPRRFRYYSYGYRSYYGAYNKYYTD